MTLTEFLLARIAEDEERARIAQHDDEEQTLAYLAAMRRIVDLAARSWFPAEVEIVPNMSALKVAYWLILCDLAAVWGDHPDCREEWKP